MKSRRIISFLLVALLMVSSMSIAAHANTADLAGTGYYNQSTYENYATKAAAESGYGCTYTKSATTFKVWAPEATSVSVKRYSTGTDAESGAAVLGTDKMNYNSTTGAWSLTLSGDHKNEYYTYIVDRKGVINETQDPYATAVGANGNRSMVCDLDSTDPDGWANDKHVFFNNPGEAVVWEVHVRDFSIDASSGVSDANKGKYLAFTEGNTTVNGKGKVASCVDYLVEHNVNCVQLMPIEDFASIDETDDAVRRNWGYDPKNYNVPEGSYSSDPYDGNTRIKEFKMLVQALHDRGIAVVMDVVYNHTFVLEGSSLNMTTPNYYYRKSSAENYHNGSGLGNVLSSEKAMTSKFISDSLIHWVNEYHIDGFRFDLMGCHDVTNMKKWRANLDKIDQRVMMYGEPWPGGGDNGISNGISNSNLSQLTRVGAFNQDYSDALKGDHEKNNTSGTGFLNGKSDTEIRKAGAGQASYFPGAKVNQFINYLDNHDNLTIFDKILAGNGASGFKAGKDGLVTNSNTKLITQNKNAVNNPSAQVLGQMKVALTSALTSQGIPFTVAGTEFCRTKYGDANSYRSEDAINAIDWTRAETYAGVADYYAGLIAIRKAFNSFTNNTSVSTTTVSGCTAWQISNSTSGQWSKIIVALNNTSAAKSITCSGNWTVVANGTKAGTTALSTASGSYSVPAWSGVVLVDSASFGNYKQPNPGTATVITEHYTRDSASGSYTKIKTETAKYKEGQTWRASKSLAILFDHNFDKTESTASGNATYGAVTAGATTTVKFYYTRNIKSGYLTVNFLNTSGGARIKTPMKYRMRNGDPYSIPATSVMGYELDTTKYPAMTRGNFNADNPPTFNFYYKKLTNTTSRVHFYKTGTKFANSTTILCYAYDDDGNEPLGAWPIQTKGTAGMKNDSATGAGWVYIDVPSTSCYVMFHYGDMQMPGQGEQGYKVAGEAWIKAGIVSFNNKIVTSHIDIKTGKQVSADVTKEYTNVSSNKTYTTAPVTTLNRKYHTPANASGYYEAGVTNVVYLYEDASTTPTEPSQPPTQPGTKPVGSGKLMGDTDENDTVTVLDATMIQRVLAQLAKKTASYDIVGDVDGDKEVTILDATAIQRYLAGFKNDKVKIDVRIQADDPTQPVTPTDPPQPTEPPYTEPTDDPYDDPTDPWDDEQVTIYFTNNMFWDSVYAYTWTDGTDGSWPGEAIYPIGTNDYGQDIYELTLGANDYVIFNDGGDPASQTVDIAVSSLFENAIYCMEEQDENGHYLYGEWTYDPDNPDPGPDPGPGDGKMYMVPSSEWKSDGARFAAYFFDGNGGETWVNLKYAGDNLYSVDLPDGYGNIIFVRMNGATTENNWDNKWNQTADLTVSPGSTYTINGWEQ